MLDVFLCCFFPEGVPEIDFKGEAITFRTTTAAVLDTLAHCAELVTQREEAWRKRLERETERRRRCESLSKSYFEQLQKMRVVHPGPDLEVRIIAYICAHSWFFSKKS